MALTMRGVYEQHEGMCRVISNPRAKVESSRQKAEDR